MTEKEIRDKYSEEKILAYLNNPRIVDTEKGTYLTLVQIFISIEAAAQLASLNEKFKSISDAPMIPPSRIVQ